MRMLVVEDEAFISILLEDHLNEIGHEVVVASSVETAFTVMDDEKRIDGAILDFNLGGEMSTPIIERLAGDGVPFVMATGYTIDTLPPPARRAAGHFTKPYSVPDVCETLIRVATSA